MKIFLIIFNICILLILPSVGQANIYVKEDSNGNTLYTDIPTQNASSFTLPPANATAPISISQEENAPPAEPLTIDPPSYTAFSLSTPDNQNTIQNQTELTLLANIEPKLKEGDKIQIVIDGKIWPTPFTNASIHLSPIDRGQHEVYALIIDARQAIIKRSNTLTIYFHRASNRFNNFGN